MYEEWDEQFPIVNGYSSMLQEIKVSKDLGREELFELGLLGIYHRISGFGNFPVNIKTDVEENFPIWY